jgi:uncharacterized protein (TIGR03437 family)
MPRCLTVFLSALLLAQSGVARQIKVICGTSPERRKEELHLHRQAVLARRAAQLQANGTQGGAQQSTGRDIGNVAIIEDSDGVVAKRNPFNLDLKTLTFTPTTSQAAAYKFRLTSDPYDASAASAGHLVKLGDDDFRVEPIPFPFAFFGNTYQNVFINSDGNLTFNAGDNASTDRSLGRMVAGEPRISPLFRDLDPSKALKGVTVTSDATRFVVSWVQVPEYSDFGTGALQTFQVRLYPDGHIQFAYNGINTSSAVVGIAPGNFQGSSSVVSFLAGSSATYSSTVAERFGGANEIDIEIAAQKFYETHDDAYDYIAFFNDEDIPAGLDAVSWEQTVRNNRTGYGDFPVDDAGEYGSPTQLQAVLNLGPLSQFPVNPTDLVSLRAESGYNTLKLIAHEAGHLFLAYASVSDPNNSLARPMLGLQQAHWAFNFNADASFMEGNRLLDNGPNAEPRYKVTATVEEYSPLDQYLMGFRPAGEVPPSFLVTGNPPGFSLKFPQVGITFDGGRRDIQVDEIIEAEGRRTPDSTVAQRHFRIAFVIIVKQGSTPPATEIAQVEGYRSPFETFYAQATGGRAHVDTTLRHALALSVAPAAGVVAGGAITATVSIQRAAPAPLTVNLVASSSGISVPGSVVIPKGATGASFTITGVQQGVEDLSATVDNTFETAYARVQVLQPALLILSTVSGNKQVIGNGGALAQSIILKVTDQNNLVYPGASVQAVPSSGGTVTPQVAVTDASGQVNFQWTPGPASDAQLQVFLDGTPPAQGVSITALPPTSINAAGVVNAASFANGITPGGLSTIYGTTLAGGTTQQAGFPWPTELANVTVKVNNKPAQLLYVSDSQINFLAPADLAPGSAAVTVSTGAGTSASLQVPVTLIDPGIFFDVATNFGAILNAGTAKTTQQHPAARGQYIEIYCTGLGTVQKDSAGLMATVTQPQVSIGNLQATVTFSGFAGLYGGGLYQVDAQIPQGTPSGTQTLTLMIGGATSNAVKVAIQ